MRMASNATACILSAIASERLPVNHRVMRFVDWIQTVPCEPHFANRPEFQFFADLTSDELLAAERELVRRIAVLGTGQEVRPVFPELRASTVTGNANDP